jgi:large subunit ribosomal protein L6
MSRIGKQPIEIPDGVNVAVDPGRVTVNGPLGELTQNVPVRINIDKADGTLVVTRPTNRGDDRALHGLTRTLVNNMVTGVTTGFTKNLEISGVGYRAQADAKNLKLQLGFSHDVEVPIPAGIQIKALKPTEIEITGAGHSAAECRHSSTVRRALFDSYSRIFPQPMQAMLQPRVGSNMITSG